jgi:hypothetical protein
MPWWGTGDRVGVASLTDRDAFSTLGLFFWELRVALTMKEPRV